MSNYKINNVDITVPHSFNINEIDLRNDGRVASGLMVTDFIATKKMFDLKYVLLKGSDLATILTQLRSAVFVTFTYPTDTGSETVTVTKHSLPRLLWANPTAPLEKVYRDIRIRLIEQ